jgi:hypothetical protein
VGDDGSGRHSVADQFTPVIHTLKAVAAGICANPARFGITSGLAEAFFNDSKWGFIQVRP